MTTFDELFAEHNLTPEERKALVMHLATLRAQKTVQALHDSHVQPGTDRVEGEAAEALAEYDDALSRIDAALATPAEQTAQPVEALELALLFHQTYERLAPQFGYETRAETRAFDPNSPNGKLMVAVCERLQAALQSQAAEIAELRAKAHRNKA